jgi:hypothetical protein
VRDELLQLDHNRTERAACERADVRATVCYRRSVPDPTMIEVMHTMQQRYRLQGVNDEVVSALCDHVKNCKYFCAISGFVVHRRLSLKNVVFNV